MSLFKNIRFGASEQRYLQLRLEAFNVFNHPNFQNKYYNVNVADTDTEGPWQWRSSSNPVVLSKGDKWGQYSNQYGGVGGPRVVQLGAKFYF